MDLFVECTTTEVRTKAQDEAAATFQKKEGARSPAIGFG